jgi:hypothetical protein
VGPDSKASFIRSGLPPKERVLPRYRVAPETFPLQGVLL